METKTIQDVLAKLRKKKIDEATYNVLNFLESAGYEKLQNDKYSITRLYYQYKRTDDDKIREYLNKIKIVKETNKGVGTLHGYYPLSDESLAIIAADPRHKSLTFDATDTADKPIDGLAPWKDVIYLVKSSSRFFLKPDIGEIFDAIDWRDLYDNKIKAIQFINDYETVPDTEGEHFLMVATLLVDANSQEAQEKAEAVKALHEIEV
jgi:hypothetical protein